MEGGTTWGRGGGGQKDVVAKILSSRRPIRRKRLKSMKSFFPEGEQSTKKVRRKEFARGRWTWRYSIHLIANPPAGKIS